MKTAVVGVGYLGRFHAQKHRALGHLQYVCDASSARAQEVARELNCEALFNPRDLLGKVDAVTVAADTTVHFELCKLFLSHGIHVLVEKPICATVAQAEEIVELAEKMNLKLAVGHVERFNPAFVAGQKTLVKPSYIQIQRLAPFKPRSLSVDVVLDLMIHDLDLAATLAGSAVTDIFARGSKVITAFNDACDAWLKFANGVEASLQTSRVDQKTQRTVTVFDSQGIVQMDLGTQTAHRLCQAEGLTATPLDLKIIPVLKWDALQKETEVFFDAVKNNKEVPVSGRQGLEALRSAEKILELTR